jgi:GNAT superfamily N-acetyltransferase
VSSYRFCRTDDIGLLVDALNRCWLPYFPDQPAVTPAAFKRSIRDLQVWCSSCMVAFSGSDTIGVLVGAKRPSSTLVHKIAVHPDHRRQGHGRHLLASLGSKLAILGPPRIVAEVPETLAPACELFRAGGYVQEALLTDYVLERPALTLRPFENLRVAPSAVEGRQAQGHPERSRGMSEQGDAVRVEGFVIPVTVDDLAANGLLEEAPSQTCWERSVETLTARKDDIAGLALASDERIEAYVLYVKHRDPGSGIGDPRVDVGTEKNAEIVSLRSFVKDGGARLKQLLAQLCAQGMENFRFPKVHPAEISKEQVGTLGFRPAGGHLLFEARARSA